MGNAAIKLPGFVTAHLRGHGHLICEDEHCPRGRIQYLQALLGSLQSAAIEMSRKILVSTEDSADETESLEGASLIYVNSDNDSYLWSVSVERLVHSSVCDFNETDSDVLSKLAAIFKRRLDRSPTPTKDDDIRFDENAELLIRCLFLQGDFKALQLILQKLALRCGSKFSWQTVVPLCLLTALLDRDRSPVIFRNYPEINSKVVEVILIYGLTPINRSSLLSYTFKRLESSYDEILSGQVITFLIRHGTKPDPEDLIEIDFAGSVADLRNGKLVRPFKMLLDEATSRQLDHVQPDRAWFSSTLGRALMLLTQMDWSDKRRFILQAVLPLLQAGATCLPDPLTPSDIEFRHLGNIFVGLENRERNDSDFWLSYYLRLVTESRRKSSLDVSALMTCFDDINSDLVAAEAVALLRKGFPRSLQAICRIAIHRNLPTGMAVRSSAINSLNLPEHLEGYLYFDDFL